MDAGCRQENEMIFKCKNCGGNVVYDPEKKRMHCPYCDGEETQEREAGKGLTVCSNCGAPLEAGEYGSAVRCEYCGHYTIFEQRVEGEWRPRLILPFCLGKKQAVSRMEEEFKRRLFAPPTFLSEASLEKMEGIYVPYWLYDMTADCTYSGTGSRVRVWVSGDTEYTETSYFQVNRELEVDFRGIPVDASLQMDDEVMELVEPFQYEELTDFAPEYMSGFLGEVYNEDAQTLSPRAENRARQDAGTLLHQTLDGYAAVIPQHDEVRLNGRKATFALLPVWKYCYRYRDREYDFYVNGQNGKVVGKAPLSVNRMVLFGGAFFACLSCILMLVKAILEVI